MDVTQVDTQSMLAGSLWRVGMILQRLKTANESWLKAPLMMCAKASNFMKNRVEY